MRVAVAPGVWRDEGPRATAAVARRAGTSLASSITSLPVDWDPRWGFDEEQFKKPCPKGHVDRAIYGGKLACRTCNRDRFR